MDPKEIEKIVKKFAEKKPRLNFLAENRIDYQATLDEVIKVLKTKHLDILDGIVHKEFEKEFAKWMGVKHAVFVNSGTAALFCALRAANVGPKDEVIVPPFTFMATASSVLHTNAIPVFADIEKKTYNMDPNAALKKITPKTKAIIPVHLGGMPADLGPLIDKCRDEHIFLLEDACQAHGAKYNKKFVGSIGNAGCFSFFPSKNMTTGEGGMITTNDDELAKQCEIIRHHGESGWYEFARLGWHLRPTELSAAVGMAQIKKLESSIKKRQAIWFYLTEQIRNVKGVTVPEVPDYAEPSANWWGAVIDAKAVGCKDVTEYTMKLNKEGAFTKVLYPEPLYMTSIFQKGDSFIPFPLPQYPKGLCPVCEELNPKLIAIDTHPEITKEHCDFVINRFKSVANGQ